MNSSMVRGVSPEDSRGQGYVSTFFQSQIKDGDGKDMVKFTFYLKQILSCFSSKEPMDFWGIFYLRFPSTTGDTSIGPVYPRLHFLPLN